MKESCWEWQAINDTVAIPENASNNLRVIKSIPLKHATLLVHTPESAANRLVAYVVVVFFEIPFTI